MSCCSTRGACATVPPTCWPRRRRLAGSLAKTWACRRATAFPPLHLPFDRLLAHTTSPVWSVTAAARGPGRADGRRPRGWDPVVGEPARLVARLGKLAPRRLPRRRGRRRRGLGGPHPQQPARRGLRRARSRRRHARARRHAARQQAGGPHRGRHHRSPARPPRAQAAGALDQRVLRRHGARQLRRAPPPRCRSLRRHGHARHRRRRARLPAARVPRRRQALRAERPDRHAAAVLGWRDAVAVEDGRRRLRRTKAKVRSAVREIAQELVVLYQTPRQRRGARVRARHARGSASSRSRSRTRRRPTS